MKSRKSLSSYLLVISATYLLSFMIISPTRTMSAAESALNICGKVIIPSLFPFIFCANMLISMGIAKIISRYISKIVYPLFKVSGAGSFAIILGIVSGYPIGAVCAATLYKTGECSKGEAEKLLSFCNNSGPMFVIGAIGSELLKNYMAGIALYCIHIISALICGIVFRNYGIPKHISKALPPSGYNTDTDGLSRKIADSLTSSVDSILKICGFIIIFAVFTSILPNGQLRKYVYSFIEITGGINELISSGLTPITLPLVSAFLSFSGLSVLAQVASVAAPVGLSLKPYVLGKTFQSVLSFILAYLFFRFFPISTDAFASAGRYSFALLNNQSLIFQAMTALTLFIILLSLLLIIREVFKKNDRLH